MIEISSLDFGDSFQLNERDNDHGGSGFKSSNFGSGIELLMNDKVKDSGSKKEYNDDFNMDDLNHLEEELNNLTDNNGSGSGMSYQSKSDLFGNHDSSDSSKHSVRFGDLGDSGPSIGKATADSSNPDSKTWDGYGKFNNIPMNPDKVGQSSTQPQMSKEDLLREKFKYLRKLEALEKKGVELSKKYTMESPLAEMQGEYETIMEEKVKENSVKFQGNMMMAIINGIEFLNNRFDPFDIKLDGWSEQINENITDYDDVFGELYEKYKSKASLAPELKLLFQLGGSAMMVHMTNTMFKSAMPGMDDILRQNPDLMRQFQNAAVNSMAQTNPGFSGFMSGIMNPEPQVPSGYGPPPPMATQGPNSVPPPVGRPGNNNYATRPDLGAGRGGLGNSIYVDDGINIRETYAGSGMNLSQESKSNSGNNRNFSSSMPMPNEPVEPPQRSKRPTTQHTRPEMRGPSDISDILSGLKTKTINIQEQAPKTLPHPAMQAQAQPQAQAPPQNTGNMNFSVEDDTASVHLNDNSTISISELKELQSSGNIPKRSTNRRKQKSDKNTISLDI